MIISERIYYNYGFKDGSINQLEIDKKIIQSGQFPNYLK